MKRLLSSYLDAVRFTAAFAVALGHAKLQTPAPNLAISLLGSFAHYAVIAFFVVSGYLVGGQLYGAGRDGFATKYLIDRASRIYTVAIPAIVISFALMKLQIVLYGHALRLTGTCDASAWQVAGSLLFLHRGVMANPCFDGPYWSLVYEVFYYLLFFAAALFVGGRHRLISGTAVVVLGVYGLAEPGNLYAYSTLWLLGMALAGPSLRFLAAAWSAVAFQTLLRAHDPVAILELVSTGLVVASITILERVRWEPPQWFSGMAARGAGVSYSLYLFHAPVMDMMRAAGLTGYALYVSLPCVASVGFWYVFQRHTGAVRAAMTSLCKAPSAVAGKRLEASSFPQSSR